MISAAKADGQIDQAEMQKIIGKISADQVTAEEKQFVLDQMARRSTSPALASEVRSPAQAAQVYAASILAIDADTDAREALPRRTRPGARPRRRDGGAAAPDDRRSRPDA